MSDKQQEQPYKVLGEKLKDLRQKFHESVADVSGAVEIDEQVLVSFEQGKERPDEEALMLLINHFKMKDDDAADLWELAGYEIEHDADCDGHCRDRHMHDHEDGDYDPHRKPEPQVMKVMLTAMLLDPRASYTDGAQVTANANGVVIGFSQNTGTPQVLTTAKVGMSREQAYSLMRTLARTLNASEPRQLPKGDDQSSINPL